MKIGPLTTFLKSSLRWLYTAFYACGFLQIRHKLILETTLCVFLILGQLLVKIGRDACARLIVWEGGFEAISFFSQQFENDFECYKLNFARIFFLLVEGKNENANLQL